ncbi:hypothetical protein [Hymenobacter nivis]|nr:hypothetical protein [Hymenobacter nivis]
MQKLLLLLVLVGALRPARAQTPAAPGPDTILRRDGQEIQGRVVVLTPTELRYLPAAPAPPDTLALPVAEVFLIRYANGTREVLPPAPAAGAPADPLAGLGTRQRDSLGRRDAATHYRTPGAFWGAAGAAFGASPVYGIAVPIVLSAKPVKPVNFQAPDQTLLLDPSYQHGYQQQANSTKRKQAWAGYATGTGAWAVLFGALLIAVASSWH